jgi:uncharacterized caspase-like protein
MHALLITLLAFLVWSWSALGDAAAQSQKRIALVIGNSSYRHAPALPNPKNDAEDMAAALRRVGFKVVDGVDLEFVGMRRALAQFEREARDASAAVVFYAGHGVQYEAQNYLVPVDAKLSDGYAVKHETLEVEEIMRVLDKVQGPRVLILDACRDLPLAGAQGGTQMLSERRSDRGLAKISRAGTVVVYATQTNDVAYDGTGRNSIFTGALLQQIEQPLEIVSMFRRVSAAVEQQSARRQTPELSLSLSEEFYFMRKEDIQAREMQAQRAEAARLAALRVEEDRRRAEEARVLARAEEERRRVEEARQAAARAEEERRRIEETRQAARAEEERRRAEEARQAAARAEEARLAAAARAEETRRAEAARRAEEAARKADEARRAEQEQQAWARLEQDMRRREEERRREEMRMAAARAEEARQAAAEESRRAEAARRAEEERRKADETRAAAVRAEEERRRAEEIRVAALRAEEERRRAEEARVAALRAEEERRRAEQARREEARPAAPAQPAQAEDQAWARLEQDMRRRQEANPISPPPPAERPVADAAPAQPATAPVAPPSGRQTFAALEQPTGPGRGVPDHSPLSDDLIRTAQQELRRLGCYTGDVDGDVGPGTREGLERYNKAVRGRDFNDFDNDLVAALKNQKSGVCVAAAKPEPVKPEPAKPQPRPRPARSEPEERTADRPARPARSVQAEARPAAPPPPAAPAPAAPAAPRRANSMGMGF